MRQEGRGTQSRQATSRDETNAGSKHSRTRQTILGETLISNFHLVDREARGSGQLGEMG
jgi:hypothetical protein